MLFRGLAIAVAIGSIAGALAGKVARRSILVTLAALGLWACGQSDSAATNGNGAAAAEGGTASAQHAAEEERAQPVAARRRERPLPAFSGRTLGGEPIEIASYIGRRLVVAFVNPEVPAAESAARALAAISPLRGKHNFEIIGIAVGTDRATAQDFATRHDIQFPVIDDASGALTRRFGLRGPVTIFGVDAEGFVTFGSGGIADKSEEATRALEEQLRADLRLPPAAHEARAPGILPEAPDFTARRLDGGNFQLSEQRGRAVVLLFFLHTCPHCHEVLSFLKQELERLPDDAKPLLVGLELTGRAGAVRQRLEEDGLDFFDVIFDDAQTSVQKAYGVFAGVPDMVLIDAEGRIVDRVRGWSPATDAPLTRMRLAKLAGAPIPMLLSDKGYTGSEVCGVCHESEHQTWQLTQHAAAFDTLVTHGSDTDAECVGCHVVGFGQPAGFEISPRTEWLEDVGCEMCHGRGGPHRSPDFMERVGYEQACLQCHDSKHSLGFDFATFLPRVSHAANRAILALPPDERERHLAERGAVRKSLLPTQAAYVGSQVCQDCHASEHETWSRGPHAGAVSTLTDQGKQDAAECLRCHTTAMGSPGGFPSDGAVADHADLARVGCESCHGPGGDHVREDAPKLGSIVSLGDKCDSCVILQICGSCHDDANDPGFEFEVQAKIERIRHGTIEAGTGKPLSKTGGASAKARLDAAALFAWVEGRSETPPGAPAGWHP